MPTERCSDFVSPLIVNGCTQAASHTKLREEVLRPSASISKGVCADQDGQQSFLSTSSTDASSMSARRQKLKGGREKPEQMSAALRYPRVQEGNAANVALRKVHH